MAREGRENLDTGIGKAIKPLESRRFLLGQGRYVNDIQLQDMLHCAIVRSPHAHARILNFDLNRARSLTGVVAVFSFEDISKWAQPIPVRLHPSELLEPFLQYPLAHERVRYVGEPIALVVAESRYLAEDAREKIEVQYDPLPAAVDAESPDPAVVLHEAAPDNVANHFVKSYGDIETAFTEADHIVRTRFRVGRHTGMPLETRGLVAFHDRSQKRLRVWGPTKVPHFNRSILAAMLKWPESRIEFFEPDVGGGFGVRGEFYPEDFLIPFAAIRLERPLKWIEGRMEHFVACNHSRQQIYTMELAVRQDGTLLGVRVKLVNDMGAYLRTHGILVPDQSASMFPGPYVLPSYHCEVYCLLTNKTPTGTYRGPGLFEANAARERLLDLAAHKLAMDPAELRLKNLIPPEALPYRPGTASLAGEVIYDSGDYPYALREALRLCDYREQRKKGHGSRAWRRGLGLACFVEKSGTGPFEGARVTIDCKGQVAVNTGACSVGQGMETMLAQIVGDVLDLNPEAVQVRHGDTDLIPRGVGTFASRTTIMAGNAAYQAALEVREKLLQRASRRLGLEKKTLKLRHGSVGVNGGTTRALTLKELCKPIDSNVSENPSLDATCYFEARDLTYSHGVVAAEVAVDLSTGRVIPKQIWIVYDVGNVINPQNVNGQIQGGAAQGVGGALLEELVYDTSGQLINGTFTDYLLPKAFEMPLLSTHRLDRSPSSLNPLGVKGAGECGIVGIGGALANAVADALGSEGAKVDTLPLTPERVWRWLQAGEEKPV